MRQGVGISAKDSSLIVINIGRLWVSSMMKKNGKLSERFPLYSRFYHFLSSFFYFLLSPISLINIVCLSWLLQLGVRGSTEISTRGHLQVEGTIDIYGYGNISNGG